VLVPLSVVMLAWLSKRAGTAAAPAAPARKRGSF
jgi:hypothetical protein